MTVVNTVVFALAPGGGNPGPVVFGGAGLSTDAMRGWAERLGAETAFVLPSTRADCAVRLRYLVRGTRWKCACTRPWRPSALAAEVRVGAAGEVQTRVRGRSSGGEARAVAACRARARGASYGHG